MRVFLSSYVGNPRSVDEAIIRTESNDLRMLIETAMTLYDPNQMFKEYEYLGNWNIRLLYDIIKLAVIEDKKIHLERFIVENIVHTLWAYKNLKIKHHEQEHRESGPHWATTTDFYRWNPADMVQRFYRMYYNDGKESQWSIEYAIDTGSGLNIFVDGKRQTPAVAPAEV